MTSKKGDACCKSTGSEKECCTVTAIATVDAKGQILLPKDIRNQMGIKSGDKLALVSMHGKKNACCIMLIKADELNSMVKLKVDMFLGEKAV